MQPIESNGLTNLRHTGVTETEPMHFNPTAMACPESVDTFCKSAKPDIRFGHGNTGRHISILMKDFAREFRRLAKANKLPEGIATVEEFVAQKLARRGGKDWRK